MKWGGRDVSISKGLIGEKLGFEPCGDGIWKIWFEHLELGLFDERRARIKRYKQLPGFAPREEAS